MFDAGKTRMIGLPYGEKKQYVKPFSYNCFLVMDDFKISKLDRFRFDFLKKI